MLYSSHMRDPPCKQAHNQEQLNPDPDPRPHPGITLRLFAGMLKTMAMGLLFMPMVPDSDETLTFMPLVTFPNLECTPYPPSSPCRLKSTLTLMLQAHGILPRHSLVMGMMR